VFTAAACCLLSIPAADACPRVACPGVAHGTGVVVGTKDGFAYVLTAAHVVKYDGVEVRFRPNGSAKDEWYADEPKVLERWPDPDIALVRFRIGGNRVPVLPLAGPGDRPRAFPAAVRAVGAEGEAATAWFDQIRAKRFVRKAKDAVAFYWETELPPVGGRSGGPLLDDRGRVIGICSANQGGLGYYTHTDEILAALKRGGYGWLVPK
jgi:S1-C subfamily serine protease